MTAQNTQSQFNEIQFEKEVFDNGLTVIYHTDNSVPAVSIVTHYKVGSSYEEKDKTGYAHFFEHMMFSETKNIPKGKIEEYIQEAGGNFNAHTSFEETVYKTTLPAHQLPLALWIESERMQNLKLNDENISKEKKVVIEEKKMSVDNAPYGKSLSFILSNLFGGTPYAWEVIGDETHIREAKPEDFSEFYNKYYQPANAIISISGDFEIDTARKYITKYFADIEKQKIEKRKRVRLKRIEKEIVKEFEDDFADVPALFVAYYGPALKDKNYAYDLLINILSDGESSRLHKRLVSDEEKALIAVMQTIMFQDFGLTLFLSLPGNDTKLQELLALFDEELEKIINSGISDNELKKAKNSIESSFVSSKFLSVNNALLLSKYEAVFNKPDKINDDLKEYLSVSKDDIIKAAKEIFDTKARVILYHYPKNQQ